MARSAQVFEDIADSIEHLNLAILSANTNLKEANTVLSKFQHSQTDQNDNIQKLRDDLNHCMQSLQIQLKNNALIEVVEEPPGTSAAFYNQTVQDSGLATETHSTNHGSFQKSKLGALSFEEWLENVHNVSYEAPLMSHSGSSSLSVIEKNVSLTDKQYQLKMDNWKRKVYKVIGKWKEKCQSLEESLETEKNNLKLEKQKTLQLKNHCFQLEVCLEVERKNYHSTVDNLVKIEHKKTDEQKELLTKIDDLNKIIHSLETYNLNSNELQKEKKYMKSLLEQETKVKNEYLMKLKDSDEKVKKLQADKELYKELLLYLNNEVDVIAGLLSFQASVPFQTFSMPREPFQKSAKCLTANIKCKLKWILEEVHILIKLHIETNSKNEQ